MSSPAASWSRLFGTGRLHQVSDPRSGDLGSSLRQTEIDRSTIPAASPTPMLAVCPFCRSQAQIRLRLLGRPTTSSTALGTQISTRPTAPVMRLHGRHHPVGKRSACPRHQRTSRRAPAPTSMRKTKTAVVTWLWSS